MNQWLFQTFSRSHGLLQFLCLQGISDQDLVRAGVFGGSWVFRVKHHTAKGRWLSGRMVGWSSVQWHNLLVQNQGEKELSAQIVQIDRKPRVCLEESVHLSPIKPAWLLCEVSHRAWQMIEQITLCEHCVSVLAMKC